MPELIQPSVQQVENAASMGWQHFGDGIFHKGDSLGYYTKAGFVKL